MKSFLKVSVWLVVVIAVFGIGCQPEAGPETTVDVADALEIVAESQAQPETQPEVKVPQPQIQVEAKPEVTADADVVEAKVAPEVDAKAVEEKVEAHSQVAEPQPSAPAETTTEAVAGTEAQTTTTAVAVTVNGVDILDSDVEVSIKPRLDRIAARSTKVPPWLIEQYKSRALNELINELLVNEKVKALNMEVTEEEVISHLEQIGAQEQPPLSLEDIKAGMQARGQSFDQVKERIKKALSFRRLLDTQGADDVNVTVEDARKYYSENPRQFETPEQVRASHILIMPDTSDPNADPNEAKAAAKAKAQELLKQIKKDGADFATLARANSNDPGSAQRGGDLNFFPRGKMVPPFDKAVFELKVGQVSDIVETNYGYHIIKLTDYKDASIIALEQVQNDIINMLTTKKTQELVAQYLGSLKADANIVYPPGKEPKPIVPGGIQIK